MYRSLLCGKCGSALLLMWRLLCLAVLAICNIYLYFLQKDGTMRRFGSWNNVLVVFYFLFATEMSMFHVRPSLSTSCRDSQRERERNSDRHHRESSAIVEKFAALTLVLYSVATTNAFFISVLKYLYYDYDADTFTRDPLIEHLAPSIALLGDMFMNGLPFRPEHYHYALGLPVLYLFYMWANMIILQLYGDAMASNASGKSFSLSLSLTLSLSLSQSLL
jgi:hypothetical protein